MKISSPGVLWALVACLCLLVAFLAWPKAPAPLVATDPVSAPPPPKPAFLTVKDDTTEKPAPKPVIDEAVLAAEERRIQGLLASNLSADHDLILSSLLPAFIRDSPERAARLSASVAPGALHSQMMRCVAQNWTSQDAKAAENWAAQLPDQEERNEMVGAVCFQIVQANPPQAVQIAEQHGLATAPGAVVENLVQQWGEQDFSGAESYAKQLPASPSRDDMITRLAFVQSKTSPSEAAQLVVQEIAPGPQQEEAAITVLYQWASHDLAGASAWAASFPPGDFRDRAETELAAIKASQQAKN